MAILKIFSYLYDKTLEWSEHRHAPYYLACVSFIESSVFPIPPDVMLMSMGLAKPKNAWYYALITTFFSVLGGLFGYLIGYYFIEVIEPWITSSSLNENYLLVKQWFTQHGIIVVFIAGFSPIPYKLFTIAAGALVMPLFPFIVGSFLGRGLRFFLVSSLMFYMGDTLKNKLRHYVDAIGWSVFVLLIILTISYSGIQHFQG